jgi:prolyl-tRNA synthetase
MLASQTLLSQSRLDESADFVSFLHQAGFVHADGHGTYSYGLLGTLALRRLEEAWRVALRRAGCGEWLLSHLQEQALWDATGRDKAYGEELMRVVGRNGRVSRLSATAEEQITRLMASMGAVTNIDRWVFQIGTKWRDEIRTRAGLVRSREFRMLDAYHFTHSEALMMQRYEKARDVFVHTMRQMGLDVRLVKADCGEIGGLASEEIQVATGLAEDGWLEVGHCFALGQDYARAMGLVDAQGQAAWMGCHGAGMSRLLAVLLHERRKGKVLVGDASFSAIDDVLVCAGRSEGSQAKAQALYERLADAGRVVLWEDRFERAGQALTASEASGARRRWVVGDKQAADEVELRWLAEGVQRMVKLDEVLTQTSA